MESTIELPFAREIDPLVLEGVVRDRLSGCVLLPGHLDLTTVMWITKDREFARAWSMQVPVRSRAVQADPELTVPACERLTVWHETHGLAHVSREALESGEWSWAAGAIAFEVDSELAGAADFVVVAADWPRAGDLLLHGEPRERRLALGPELTSVQGGLPDGLYRVSLGTSGTPQFVTIENGARVVVRFAADAE